MLLYTSGCELCIVVALVGAEFIHTGERVLDGSRMWLNAHDAGSPLYPNGIGGYCTDCLDLIEDRLPFAGEFVRCLPSDDLR